MDAIVWTPQQKRNGGSVASPDGLISILRNVPLGARVIVLGWRAKQAGNHMRAARRGTEKRFQARTLTSGAEILRYE